MKRYSAVFLSLVALSFWSGASLAGPVAEAAAEYRSLPPKDFADVKLAAVGRPGTQAVAVNPVNGNTFLAVYSGGGFCWVRRTTNHGRTWAAAKKLPMPRGAEACKTPAVTWAPDGRMTYAAYSYEPKDDLKGVTKAGVVLTRSTDEGVTWSAPKLIGQQYYNDYITSIKLATPLRIADADWLYILSEYDSAAGPFGYTNFTRSQDEGRTWGPVQRVTSYAGNVDEATSKPSIAGGLGGDVLITWGFEYYAEPAERYIKAKHSADYGASFSPEVIVRSDSFGATAVAIGNSGTAHLVYQDWRGTREPMYVYSNKRPYTTWSSPVSLSDGLSATDYSVPTIAVSACGAASVLHALWLDNRIAVEKFHVYYSRKVAKSGENWSSNRRISANPVAAFEPGYHFSSAVAEGLAAGEGALIALWGEPLPLSYQGAVWASRVWSGVRCP